MTTQHDGIHGYIYPKDFFEKNKPSITEGLCFIVMPFSKEMESVYIDVIAKTVLECGLSPIRADQIFDTKPIMISVMQKIAEAEVIIADVTGRNANVFYELGMAHVLKEKVILITQTIEDLPFDLRHFRHIAYKLDEEGLSRLRSSLLETLTALGLRKALEESLPLPNLATGEATSQTMELQPLSTTIIFDEINKYNSFNELKNQMFAAITNWEEYEKVSETAVSLTFPTGDFSFRHNTIEFTLMPGKIPLRELIAAFGKEYEAIRFQRDEKIDIGDLIRRSRNGVRNIKEVSKDTVTLKIAKGSAHIDIRNTGEGSSITIRTSGLGKFEPGKVPVPYATVIKYLEIDPPTTGLENAVKEASATLPF